MDVNVLKSLYRWFDVYVKTFYNADPEIQSKVRQKEEHSFIVAEHSRNLALTLGLAAEEVRLAEAVGLCHDVGRFRQVTIYRTFSDRDSVDHGRLGMEDMVAAGVDDKLEPGEWQALSFAVRWHNAAALPEQPDPRLLLHARMIRDTDKLDICRVLPPGPPAEGCSQKLVADFLAGKPLYYEDLKTADDRKLIMLSWLNDVNFAWTVREIVSRGYIDRLLASLPPSADAPAIKHKIDLCVAAKLAQ